MARDEGKNTSGQRELAPGPARAASNPEAIVHIVGYGLIWIGLLMVAFGVVAMAMGRLL